MALGSMSYSVVRTCATNLGEYASEMDTLFEKLKGEMESLEDVLRSRGAEELYSTYKTLEGNLSNYPAKVRAFQDFLNEAVSQYEADDAALANDLK